MKILGNDIRSGYVIEHEGKIWRAVKTQMIQPGKGGAFMQVELRDVRSDNKLVTRFRSVEPVERVSLEEKDYQFLYAEGDLYTFMEPETYEQVQVRKDVIGDPAVFLQEGMICTLRSYEGEFLSVDIPQSVVMTITEADAVVRGQTASSSYKPAILENGVRILVPPHIEAGTRVVVNTQEGTYIERAKD